MSALLKLDGISYAGMIASGTAKLYRHTDEVNSLNVFPIPDGDTGENMLLTMRGGAGALDGENQDLALVSERVANGMLLGARGNSGVILSQFFAGIAEGFRGHESADVSLLEKAIACGVGCAFEAVMTPTPGTILTVLSDACNYAGNRNCRSIDAYFEAFIEEAGRSLDRTPDLLPVLRDAGVIDSGGAGLLYIIEGMYAYLREDEDLQIPEPIETPPPHTVDPTLFGPDSVMEFGYCTELLVRLQTAKTDIDHFDLAVITDYLKSIGNSVVTVKNDSIVKLHVHTMTPYKVLEFCQRYGEFLSVKIENMMLQHNETLEKETPASRVIARERRPFGVVAVAFGAGICSAFSELGADEVIVGGQTMNPGTADFLDAFDRVNADTIFVLPNNGNVLLAARQAAGLYHGSDIRVIPTKTLGDGYAVLSMLDFESGDADTIEGEMCDAMCDVLTVEISRSIRDTCMNGVSVATGDYIGICGKTILAAGENREDVAQKSLHALSLSTHSLLLLIRGRSVTHENASQISEFVKSRYPSLEICETDGGQDIYDYILVAE